VQYPSSSIHAIAEFAVDIGIYQTVFSLEGVPRARQFVDRPAEMEEVEHVLIPRPGQSKRQKVFVLRGLGEIGKTQLAVEFARRHYCSFSSVFWLDGQSEDSLRRSIASCASRIPEGQISEASRAYANDSRADVDKVVRDVLNWLARPDNNVWLLIYDNVDRDYRVQGGDPQSYDIKRYFPGADHGSVIVTTRLARLEQLGKSQQLGKVSEEQAQAIFESWYKEKYGKLRAAKGLWSIIKLTNNYRSSSRQAATRTAGWSPVGDSASGRVFAGEWYGTSDISEIL
jgi:hypothetical protein